MTLANPAVIPHIIFRNYTYESCDDWVLFGLSVSLSANGKRLLIGKTSVCTPSGNVYVYDYHDATRQWKPTETVSDPGDFRANRIARSLSGDGTVAAVRINRLENDFLVFDGACLS